MSFFSDLGDKIKSVLEKPLKIPFADFFSRLGGKIRHRWLERKMARDLPVVRDEVRPAMERLTTQLIEESVGKRGFITKTVHKQLQGYSKDQVPLGREAAEKILLQALELAVSRRKLLNERLADCVEFGTLYQAYYGRVHAVSAVAIEAYEYLEQMQMADEEYRYYEEMKRKVRDKTYDDSSKKPLDQVGEVQQRERDIMQSVLNEGL